MALTDAQKAKVRLYLGFSDISRQTPTHWRLESILAGSLSAEGEAVIVDLLSQLATVDTDLASVQGASRAGIVSVDNGGVVWSSNGMSAATSVANRGRMLVRRLARTIGVEPFADMFGGGPSTSLSMGLG